MAVLSRIVVQDFRNIALAELSFSPNVNCISGNNGAGKTNLLDAVWYLSMTKSAHSASDRYCFRHGTQSFALSGTYVMPNGTSSTFSLKVSADGAKKLRRDDKPYGRISEHIGEVPVVMVSPQDGAMVSESGEERRRFANAVLSQTNPQYLAGMQQYNRLLAQRNQMLKGDCPDMDLLEVVDTQMQNVSVPLHKWRKELVEKLAPAVQDLYKVISGGGEQVSISLSSDLDKAPLGELLARSREKDRVLRFTSVGLQRDDLLFEMDGHPIRRCGSQGQQKSFLVALKMAQYEVMKKDYGYSPILLLDDVFDKLDMDRISNLLAMVAGEDFGQIFITDSNKVRMQRLVDGITSDRAYFETEAGTFRRVDDPGQ